MTMPSFCAKLIVSQPVSNKKNLNIESLLKNRQAEVYFLQKGSAQPHVYPKDVMALKLLKPLANLIESFEGLISPLFEEIKILSQKNQLLQQTRDLLLPRPISGKLSVEGLAEAKEYVLGQNGEPWPMAAEAGYEPN